MRARDVVRTLSKGDIVKVSRTVRILERDAVSFLFQEETGDPWLNCQDVQPINLPMGLEAMVFQVGGSAEIEVVKKARRQRQQFTTGQVITSDTLREVMWLRGTVIEAVKNGAAFVLREDGKWHDILGGGCECATGWPFEDFAGDYKLLRLP